MKALSHGMGALARWLGTRIRKYGDASTDRSLTVAAPIGVPGAGGVPESHRELATLCWSTTAILLGFFFFAQAGVLLSFSVGWRVSPLVAPAALLLALASGDWFARREGLRGRLRLGPPAMAVAVCGVSWWLAAAFFDMSWDGLWYHQTAIYQMAHGWNPLRDPMHSFVPSLEDYVRYYAKGPWYVAVALFQTTGHIEWAKPAPGMALAASFLAVTAASLGLGMRRRTALVVAALVSLNPVVVCELVSYLVDGLLISFMACYVAGMITCFRRPSLPIHLLALVSMVLCIGTKFSAFVFLCFFCAAGGLYLLFVQRRFPWRYAAVQTACLLVGAGVFGFNPYVTNTLRRGHPFYPWLGTAAYPSYVQRGRDPNEMYETPHNMVGRNRMIRFGYGLFGRPGSQPYFGGKDASLMWPFDVRWKDFQIFYFHEVRISGFGPLFSGAFLISLALLGAAAIRPGLPRVAVLLLTGAVVASLLVGVHMWWARYGPQLWWVPIIAIVAGWAVPASRATQRTAWGLAGLLLVNAVLVGVAHFEWEWHATRTTYEQTALLRQKGEVQVNLQYFREPFGERLRAAGVAFRAVRRLECAHPMELMSVAEGYPGQIRACVPEK